MSENANRRQGKFEGVSKRGDLREAMDNAIATAKGSLVTDFISWKLLEVSGQDGGVVAVNDITVTILAQGS